MRETLFFVLLLGSLERNKHIVLAHINPESYSQLESKSKDNTQCTMWFIGLEFAKTENLNIDLTADIQAFTENMNRHAINIKILKEGMKVEAKHVKRKHLSHYLSPGLLRREKKQSMEKNLANQSKKRLSDTNEEQLIKKKSRISEEVCASSVSLLDFLNICVLFLPKKNNSHFIVSNGMFHYLVLHNVFFFFLV